jgi:hypothetical protein
MAERNMVLKDRRQSGVFLKTDGFRDDLFAEELEESIVVPMSTRKIFAPV